MGTPAGVKKLGDSGEKIDVNQASLQELQRLPGIGPAMAARIVEKRKQEPFRAVEDLRHVSGIGVKTLEKLRPYVIVGDLPGTVVAGQ